MEITIHELATLFDLPDLDSVEERNTDWIAAEAAVVLQTMYDDTEDENAAADAEFETLLVLQQELFKRWSNAVYQVAETLFDRHNLKLIEKSEGVYRIVPKGTWRDAAYKIMLTINGVGDFQFDHVAEFLESGPYSAKEAVLAHLDYIKYQPKLTGEPSPTHMFERAYSVEEVVLLTPILIISLTELALLNIRGIVVVVLVTRNSIVLFLDDVRRCEYPSNRRHNKRLKIFVDQIGETVRTSRTACRSSFLDPYRNPATRPANAAAPTM